jgi:hypothetical protein
MAYRGQSRPPEPLDLAGGNTELAADRELAGDGAALAQRPDLGLAGA